MDEAAGRDVGRQVLNQVHRQVLLQAITEQWVEYLTRVEALRVSIGLEAYAQRDPLVQYKGPRLPRCSRDLLADIRSLVISRVFAYQPRRIQLTLTDSGKTLPNTSPAKPKLSQAVKRKASENVIIISERYHSPPEFYKSMPKVELHRHLEGSLRLDTMLDVAECAWHYHAGQFMQLERYGAGAG